MTLIHSLNEQSAIWADAMLGSLIDTTVLLLVVAIAWLLLRKRVSAHVGYCLFLIVVVKAMLPLEFSGPNWAAELSPRYQLQRLTAQVDDPVPEPEQIALLPPAVDLPPVEEQNLGLAPANMVWEPEPVADEPVLLETPALPVATPIITPAAATPAGPLEREPLSLATMLMLAWFLGACCMAGWFAVTQLRFRRRLRGATEVTADSLPVDFAALCEQAGVRLPVRLLAVEGISSPAIWGLRRPCLLLPPDFTAMFSQQQMRWVLLHELAHVRRRDLWATLFQRLVQIVHFFNPAIWIANRIVDRLREYACDDAATVGAETSRRDCGEAFLLAVERANAQPQSLEPALGIFRPGRVFHQRLFRILDPNRRIQTRLSYRSALALLLLAAVVLPCVRAAEEEPEPTPTTEASAPEAASPDIAAEQDEADAVEPAKYIAKLPDGSRVELVGISAHPSRGRRWWRADGSTLPAAPFAHVDGKLRRKGGSAIERELVFRISGPDGLAHPYVRDAEISFVGSGGSSSNGVPINEDGEPIQDLYVKTFAMPVGTKQAKFRVGLPVGEWESMADFKGATSFATSFSMNDKSYGLTVTPAQQSGTEVVLNFAHNATKERIRVMATETDGKTQHKHGRLSSLGTSGFMQMAATFSNLKLSDVKQFSIQVRKQTYVQFENISAIPGHESDVQITVEGEPKAPVLVARKGGELPDENQPFIVQGRVTDAEGEPIPEAKISLYKQSGGGSGVQPSHITKTDKEGRYKLRFEPSSDWFQDSGAPLPHIGFFVQKADYQMAEGLSFYPAVNRLPDERLLALSGKSADDIFVRGKPKTIDFVLKPWDPTTAPLSPEQKSFVHNLTRDVSDITKPLPKSRVKSEDQAILGTWKLSELIAGNSSGANIPEAAYTFRAGGVGIVKSGAVISRFKYTLDTKSKPKSISLKGVGHNALPDQKVAYQVTDDQLKMAVSMEGPDKPVDFDVKTAAKSKTVLMVLDRAKAKPPAAALPDEKAILGKWEISQVIGSESTGLDIPGAYFVFCAGGIGIAELDSVSGVLRFKYTLNTQSKPSSITIKGGSESADLDQTAFYQFDGDQLKLAMSSEGPGKSADAEKSNTVWFVLTRVKDEPGKDKPGKDAAQQEKPNPPGWGSVTGQFLLAGEVPQPRVLVAKGDIRAKDSTVSAAKTIYSEELIVDPQTKGIANIFVFVRNVPKIHPDLLHSKSKTVVCESDGLVYKPHAMLLRTDQSLVFKNDDPVVINVHSFPQRNVQFNHMIAAGECV